MPPSVVATNIARTRAARKLFDFDPDGTSLVAVSWVPMAEFEHFLCSFFRTIGVSTVVFEIAAAKDGSGTGAAQVKAHAFGGGQPDAVGDQIWLEATAEEIANAVAGATHVSARVSFVTGTDEGVVFYERSKPKFPQDGLTADVIA